MLYLLGEVIQFTGFSNVNPTSWDGSFTGGTPVSSTETESRWLVMPNEGSFDVDLSIPKMKQVKTKLRFLKIILI